MDLLDASISTLAYELRSRRVSAVELIRATLERMADYDPTYRAFVTVDEDQAIAGATRAQREIQRGDYRGPLHGIPIAVKDMFATAGLRTTAGSQILASWIPERDADAISALRRAGAVILGKTHTTEFAVWGTGGHPMYRLPRNPWDTARSPGGSSGGSAAAVAAGLAPLALGTDTGGSTRIPAAWCGIVGYKPTRDTISTRGVIPLSWSHDHVGLLARGVADCRALLRATQACPFRFSCGKHHAVGRRLHVGVLPCPPSEATDPVQAVIYDFCERATELGNRVGAVGSDWTARAAKVSPAIQYPELAAYHAMTFGRRDDDYGPDARAGLTIGRAITAVEYLGAVRCARQLQREVDQALRDYDLLVSPVVPFAAPLLGGTEVELDGIAYDLNGVISQHTRLFNITGHPAITIPWKADPDGLPIGVQLIGSRCSDERILELAELFEQTSPWDQVPNPPLASANEGDDHDHLPCQV